MFFATTFSREWKISTDRIGLFYDVYWNLFCFFDKKRGNVYLQLPFMFGKKVWKMSSLLSLMTNEMTHALSGASVFLTWR